MSLADKSEILSRTFHEVGFSAKECKLFLEALSIIKKAQKDDSINPPAEIMKILLDNTGENNEI